MSYNPYNKNYQKHVNTPSGSIRLQLGHTRALGKFYTFTWPAKDQMVTTRLQDVSGGWAINFFISGVEMKIPANLKVKHIEKTVTEATQTAVRFLAKEYPRVGGEPARTVTKPKHVQSPQAGVQSPVGLSNHVPIEVEPVKAEKKVKVKKSKFPPLDRKKAPWRF